MLDFMPQWWPSCLQVANAVFIFIQKGGAFFCTGASCVPAPLQNLPNLPDVRDVYQEIFSYRGNGECEARISAPLRFYKRVCSRCSRSPKYVHTTRFSPTASWVRSSVATSVQHYSHCKKIRPSANFEIAAYGIGRRTSVLRIGKWNGKRSGRWIGRKMMRRRRRRAPRAVAVVANSGGQGASGGRRTEHGL